MQAHNDSLLEKFHKLDEIKITHVVDPNRIFFQYVKQIRTTFTLAMEDEIVHHIDILLHVNPNYPASKKNELVALYHPEWKKYIRAFIDFIDIENGEQNFVCWAPDYGIPIETSYKPCIKPLPARYYGISSTVLEVCLPLRPIAKVYELGSISTKRCLYWPQSTIELLREIISDNEYEFRLDEKSNHSDIYYGDILMKNKYWSRVYSLNDMLVEYDVAVAPKKFNYNSGCKIPQYRRQGARCYNNLGVCMCAEARNLS